MSRHPADAGSPASLLGVVFGLLVVFGFCVGPYVESHWPRAAIPQPSVESPVITTSYEVPASSVPIYVAAEPVPPVAEPTMPEVCEWPDDLPRPRALPQPLNIESMREPLEEPPSDAPKEFPMTKGDSLRITELPHERGTRF